MTTDITELAQSLKAAAPNVTPGPWVVKDYFWLTPESVVFSGEFVECHNGPDAQYLKLLSPENMLNLLAERDADKAIIARMAKLIAEMEFASTEKANRIAELVEALETIAFQQGEIKALLSSLESRTVKLPKLKMLEDYLAEVAIEERKQILVGVKLEFHRACVAAGIKVEAE
ncbi:TPA: hypothetical protein OUG36_001338 [Klebsiella pneumoniae]|nr:hypothetical protein [Klebsiella pneumoniae]